MSFEILQNGLVPYSEAEERQRTLAALRRSGRIGDTLWLLEHPPVLTMGRRNSIDDLLVPPEELKRRGIELAKTDRGGRMTYHGPGQLVGYFIFDLKGKTVPEFVREIEQLLIKLLQSFGLKGERDPLYPGVWINQKTTRPEGPLRGRLHRALPVEGATQAPMKIAALGFHVEKGVTRHGFALNVDCDLLPFSFIHPCGLVGRQATSLARELKTAPRIAEVKARLLSLFP